MRATCADRDNPDLGLSDATVLTPYIPRYCSRVVLDFHFSTLLVSQPRRLRPLKSISSGVRMTKLPRGMSSSVSVFSAMVEQKELEDATKGHPLLMREMDVIPSVYCMYW
jgi:hypothetical protein